MTGRRAGAASEIECRIRRPEPTFRSRYPCSKGVPVAWHRVGASRQEAAAGWSESPRWWVPREGESSRFSGVSRGCSDCACDPSGTGYVIAGDGLVRSSARTEVPGGPWEPWRAPWQGSGSYGGFARIPSGSLGGRFGRRISRFKGENAPRGDSHTGMATILCPTDTSLAFRNFRRGASSLMGVRGFGGVGGCTSCPRRTAGWSG